MADSLGVIGRAGKGTFRRRQGKRMTPMTLPSLAAVSDNSAHFRADGGLGRVLFFARAAKIFLAKRVDTPGFLV